MARIALIHALHQSIAPINTAFERQWPEASLANLLDDSLSSDLAAKGGVLEDSMTSRFLTLADYAVVNGADAVLFTCSAFGPCIETVQRRYRHLPILKPYDGLIEEVGRNQQMTGLIATFEPTLRTMPTEFGPDARVLTALAEGALDALGRGEAEVHDALIASAAAELAKLGCTQIALAQYSMARARESCEQATGVRVLTSVQSAVVSLRSRVEAGT